MKQLRIIYNTGEVNENGRPVTRRNALVVSDDATSENCEQIVMLLDSLTKYVAQEGYMVVTTQIY